MSELTAKQREYVTYMRAFFVENDQLPSNKAMCQRFRVTHNAVQTHVRAICKKGYIQKNQIGKYKRGPRFPNV